MEIVLPSCLLIDEKSPKKWSLSLSVSYDLDEILKLSYRIRVMYEVRSKAERMTVGAGGEI